MKPLTFRYHSEREEWLTIIDSKIYSMCGDQTLRCFFQGFVNFPYVFTLELSKRKKPEPWKRVVVKPYWSDLNCSQMFTETKVGNEWVILSFAQKDFLFKSKLVKETPNKKQTFYVKAIPV